MTLEHAEDASTQPSPPILTASVTDDADAARQRRELEDYLELIRWANDGGNNID